MAEDKSIIRVVKDKDNPYTVMNVTFTNDERLSWKAKGMQAYFLGKPDDWKIMICDLVKKSTDGRDSVYAGLKELINCGYVVKNQLKENGKFKGVEYVVYEKSILSPLTDNPDTAKPETEIPDTDNTDTKKPETEEPNTANPPLLSIESLPSIDKPIDDEDAHANPLFDYIKEQTKDLTPEEFDTLIKQFTKAWEQKEKHDGEVYAPRMLFDTCFINFLDKKNVHNGNYWKETRREVVEAAKQRAEEEKKSPAKNRFINFTQRDCNFDELMESLRKKQEVERNQLEEEAKSKGMTVDEYLKSLVRKTS